MVFTICFHKSERLYFFRPSRRRKSFAANCTAKLIGKNRSAQNLGTHFLCDESSPSRSRKRGRENSARRANPLPSCSCSIYCGCAQFTEPLFKKPAYERVVVVLLLLLEERSFSRRISPQDHVHSPAKETGWARRFDCAVPPATSLSC